MFSKKSLDHSESETSLKLNFETLKKKKNNNNRSSLRPGSFTPGKMRAVIYHTQRVFFSRKELELKVVTYHAKIILKKRERKQHLFPTIETRVQSRFEIVRFFGTQKISRVEGNNGGEVQEQTIITSIPVSTQKTATLKSLGVSLKTRCSRGCIAELQQATVAFILAPGGFFEKHLGLSF